MWRYLAAGIGGVLLIVAGYSFATGGGTPRHELPAAPGSAATADDRSLPDAAPEASARTREEKRFGRYDKDMDGAITRAEYLASRRKAFARLDTNSDGQLSFDEWAIKATAKFTTADGDKSGALTPAEFVTTAVVRKPKPKPKCVCPTTPAGGEDEG